MSIIIVVKQFPQANDATERDQGVSRKNLTQFSEVGELVEQTDMKYGRPYHSNVV